MSEAQYWHDICAHRLLVDKLRPELLDDWCVWTICEAACIAEATGKDVWYVEFADGSRIVATPLLLNVWPAPRNYRRRAVWAERNPTIMQAAAQRFAADALARVVAEHTKQQLT